MCQRGLLAPAGFQGTFPDCLGPQVVPSLMNKHPRLNWVDISVGRDEMEIFSSYFVPEGRLFCLQRAPEPPVGPSLVVLCQRRLVPHN